MSLQDLKNQGDTYDTYTPTTHQSWTEWDVQGRKVTEIKGIPNFFSKSMFGKTSELKYAAQFVVVFAVVAVILRMFSRKRFRTRFYWDDLCAVVSVFFLMTNQIVFSMIEFLGRTSFSWTGRRVPEEEDKRLDKIVLGLKLTLVFEVFYLISIYLVKFSMLFLYGRIAKQTKYITVYLRITQGICLVTFTLCVLSLFLSCIPIEEFWNLQNDNAQCSRRLLLTYSSGISNIVTNTLVLAVPVPLLFRASLTFRQRVGVSVLYFFGAFVIVASALRFVTLLLNVSVPQAIGWSQIEISLAIILACAPMSAKLLLYPLHTEEHLHHHDHHHQARHRDSQADTATLIKSLAAEAAMYDRQGDNHHHDLENLSPTDSERSADTKPGHISGNGKMELDLNKELPAAAQPKRRDIVFPLRGDADWSRDGGDPTAREMKSPDIHKLKVVRAEVDGQYVWAVRAVSPNHDRDSTGSHPF